jgi:tRNA A37 methylthiotransferase MiaB
MARYKTSGSAKKLIVAGCLVERYRDEIQKSIPEVDAVSAPASSNPFSKPPASQGRLLPRRAIAVQYPQWQMGQPKPAPARNRPQAGGNTNRRGRI